jgi:hypothetical protein
MGKDRRFLLNPGDVLQKTKICHFATKANAQLHLHEHPPRFNASNEHALPTTPSTVNNCSMQAAADATVRLHLGIPASARAHGCT